MFSTVHQAKRIIIPDREGVRMRHEDNNIFLETEAESTMLSVEKALIMHYMPPYVPINKIVHFKRRSEGTDSVAQ